MLKRSLVIWVSVSMLAIDAGVACAQEAKTTPKQALSSLPCPSGDSSCGNGVSSAPTKESKHKHRKHEESKREVSAEAKDPGDGSNPNQKIEEAAPNDPNAYDPGPEN